MVDLGFRFGINGPHAARTMMLEELRTLFAYTPPAQRANYASAIVADNVLGNPDLNDGVRLSIRPFMTVGVLRVSKTPKLNIKWDKDRGKDVESAPWFKVFKDERINDHHLSLAEKRAAREKAAKG